MYRFLPSQSDPILVGNEVRMQGGGAWCPGEEQAACDLFPLQQSYPRCTNCIFKCPCDGQCLFLYLGVTSFDVRHGTGGIGNWLPPRPILLE